MSSLSWRVPASADPSLLRLGLAQIGLATVVAALVLFVAVPREWLAPALLGLIPLAVIMAFRRWVAYRRSFLGAHNVRLDDAGLHWLDATGHENTFARADVLGFHIARHHDTLRAVPALTLHLAGGFESQPIELHPPATDDAIRQLLVESWRLAELNEVEAAQTADYDAAVSIYGECHEEFQEWHWEGTKEELSRLFALFAVAADELPLPPPGAKPAARVVLLSRRQPTRLRLAHSPVSHFESATLAAPGILLREISSRAVAALAPAASTSDLKFDVPLGPKNIWTFHVHVRPT